MSATNYAKAGMYPKTKHFAMKSAFPYNMLQRVSQSTATAKLLRSSDAFTALSFEPYLFLSRSQPPGPLYFPILGPQKP